MVKTWNGELRQSKVLSAIELITEINKPFQVLRFQNARLTRENLVIIVIFGHELL